MLHRTIKRPLCWSAISCILVVATSGCGFKKVVTNEMIYSMATSNMKLQNFSDKVCVYPVAAFGPTRKLFEDNSRIILYFSIQFDPILYPEFNQRYINKRLRFVDGGIRDCIDIRDLNNEHHTLLSSQKSLIQMTSSAIRSIKTGCVQVNDPLPNVLLMYIKIKTDSNTLRDGDKIWVSLNTECLEHEIDDAILFKTNNAEPVNIFSPPTVLEIRDYVVKGATQVKDGRDLANWP